MLIIEKTSIKKTHLQICTHNLLIENGQGIKTTTIAAYRIHII